MKTVTVNLRDIENLTHGPVGVTTEKKGYRLKCPTDLKQILGDLRE